MAHGLGTTEINITSRQFLVPTVGDIQILWTAGGRRYPDTADPERPVHDTVQRKIGEAGEISRYRRPPAVHGIQISPTAGISNYPNIILISVVPTPWYLFPASEYPLRPIDGSKKP